MVDPVKTVTSISGGKTSAYLAAEFPSDYNLFALVCLDDHRCAHPDKKAVEFANDKLEKYGFISRFGEFTGTAEDDAILYTIMDLEQYLGREIIWVRGESYEQVINTKGAWVPNKLHRYCTSFMKIRPMFLFWHYYIGEPIFMRIGYRANEMIRANSMQEKCNKKGFLEFREPNLQRVEWRSLENYYIQNRGKKSYKIYQWQMPVFPLIRAGIYRDTIHEYWSGKPVRFAEKNNCVACFHQNPIFINYRYNCQPHNRNKIEWAANIEESKTKIGKPRGRFISGTSYRKIINSNQQLNLSFSDFSECDMGFCEP